MSAETIGAEPTNGEGQSATRRVPLGAFVHARSGDKGGNANIGLWVGNDLGSASGDQSAIRDNRIEWLLAFITPERVRELLPETAGLAIECHELANLGGVNVVIEGILGEGVAASTRFDPQAKALGEWIRSRFIEIPEELL